jgi:hypothetical protein
MARDKDGTVLMTVANPNATHIMYRIWGEDAARPLYIGITGEEWWHRISNHARKQPWRAQIRAITVESHPTRSLALVAEERAIKREQPKYNVVHNSMVREGEVGLDDVRDELFDGFYRPAVETVDENICAYCRDEICGPCCDIYPHSMRWTVDYIIRSFHCDKPVAELYPTFCTDCVTEAIARGHAMYVYEAWADEDDNYLSLPLEFVDGYCEETAADWMRVKEARDAFRLRMQITDGPLHGRTVA